MTEEAQERQAFGRFVRTYVRTYGTLREAFEIATCLELWALVYYVGSEDEEFMRAEGML